MTRFLDRIAKVIRTYPDRVALDDGEKRLTYAGLEQESGRVYRYLKEAGIGKEDIVQIVMPRGAGMVSCIGGVLRAGAAFVSLEDTYPEERIRYIREDSGSKCVLDRELYERIMDSVEPLAGYEPTDPHDACYLVYTSGSTGNPKGVLHEYGNVDQRAGQAELKETYPEFRQGFIEPFYFVASQLTMIWALLMAYTVYIISHDMVRDYRRLTAFILEKRLQGIYLPPSYLRIYREPSPYLEYIMTGSEPADGLYYPGGKPRLINNYAMSESGFNVLQAELDRAYAVAPVGKPALEADVHLEDDDGKRIEGPGIGEICFRNEYVRGYLHLPEKTREAFRNGTYHTGDIARRDADGNCYIVGRKDDMFKVNGNRIEPAEIERRIRELTGLERVIAKGFTTESRSFICVFYLRKEAEAMGIPDETAMLVRLEELRSVLPDYMIPAACRALEVFPVNANGKTDRSRLTPPEPVKSRREYIAPRTETERILCKRMAKVLGIPAPGVTDDFFELGGDSVSVITLIAECGELPVDSGDVYRCRTAEKLARLCGERRESTPPGSLKPGTSLADQARKQLWTSSRKTLKCFREKGFIESWYAGILSLSEESLVNVRHNPCMIIYLDETVNPDRLQAAVDRVVRETPYVLYDILFRKEAPRIRFRENNRPLSVLRASCITRYGTEENNGHFTMVACAGNTVHFGISHTVTDGHGFQAFVSAVLRTYFGRAAEKQIRDETLPEDYTADLAAAELPLPDGYTISSNDPAVLFVLPECGGPVRYFSDRFTVSAAPVRGFADTWKLTVQEAICVLLARAIQEVHPDNEDTIRIRCPVDTRNIFGVPGTFQNASIPHIFLDIAPQKLKECLDELSEDLNTQFARQYCYEYLAYVTNRFGAAQRTGDQAAETEALKWYMGGANIFASYLGRMADEETARRITDVEQINDASFPLMIYVSELGDRMIVQILQKFDTPVYSESLRKAFERLRYNM